VGAGGVLFAAGSDNAVTLTGGPGTSTVFGATGSVIEFSSHQAGGIFVAGAGNETLNAAGSSASVTLSGGASNGSAILMIGGSGDDDLYAGIGSDTMTGGGGTDHFAFFDAATNGGHNYITDFTANDYVYVIGYDPVGSASALQNAASGGGSSPVTLTLSDSTQVTFTNLTDRSALDGHILYVGRSS
jgi:Ca2+-binding RTX toxin-like protein